MQNTIEIHNEGVEFPREENSYALSKNPVNYFLKP